MSFIGNNGSQTPRASRPQRNCRTPRRERGQLVGAVPGAAPQEAQVPIDMLLQDASQFPVLPKEMNSAPRGRKARRAGSAWSDINDSCMTPRARSLSKGPERALQEDSSHDAPQPESRARAYSCDAGADALADAEAENAKSQAPRGGLKKPRDSLDGMASDANKSQQAKLLQEIQERMLQLSGAMGGSSHVGMELNKLLANLPSEPEAKSLALPAEQEAKPRRTTSFGGDDAAEAPRLRTSFGGDDAAEAPRLRTSFGGDDAAEAEATGVTRPRRLSNPRSGALELPSGGSWEYPLTKEEKKARVVMIGEVMNESLQDEVADLQELVSTLSVEPKE